MAGANVLNRIERRPYVCDCCGEAERLTGCVRGILCMCGYGRCLDCGKCNRHCACPEGIRLTRYRKVLEEIAR